MKKAISIVLSLFMLLSLMFTACAAEETQIYEGRTVVLKIGNPYMTVNGREMSIDEQGTVPIIVNDRTLLPVRALIEQLGGSVQWNGDVEEVSLKYGDDEINLTIDSDTAYLNNEERTLDSAPIIVNDRTMLPIRFIAESFKFSVEWNEQEQSVTISSGGKSLQEPSVKPDDEQKTAADSLVVYFSATGNTKALAEKIAAETNSDIFEIIPEQPYTSEDLNYNTDCRANKEQNDDNARPAISNKLENIDDYDVIFIGYPIWWGTMPKIINTFLDTYDLTGKKIMPFCTSGSSGISSSVSAIKTVCPNADVKSGFRGTGNTDAAQISTWIDENN